MLLEKSPASNSQVLNVFVANVKDVVGLSRRLCVTVPLRVEAALKLLASYTLHLTCLSTMQSPSDWSLTNKSTTRSSLREPSQPL